MAESETSLASLANVPLQSIATFLQRRGEPFFKGFELEDLPPGLPFVKGFKLSFGKQAGVPGVPAFGPAFFKASAHELQVHS